MSLELRHVRYLLAVADHGNFTRAAEYLHVSQPTLSQQIRQMERALGVQLLDRSGRAVRLTDAGEAYVGHVRHAVQDLAAAERAVHDVQDLSRGHLRLATTPTFTAYLVGPLTADLHARHPGITLTVREMPQDRIEAELLSGDIDLGIAFTGSHLAGITASTLFTETLSLVAGTGTGTDTGTGQPRSASDLEGRQLALLTGDFATRRHIDAYFARHRIRPHIAVEANSIQALTEIVQRTSLATVLPDAIARDHADLTLIPLDPELPARAACLLSRTDGYQSAAARMFSRIAREFTLPAG
ncbi:transcriptional regulator CynR [Streptomyces sp. NPDC003832]